MRTRSRGERRRPTTRCDAIGMSIDGGDVSGEGKVESRTSCSIGCMVVDNVLIIHDVNNPFERDEFN